MKSIFIIAGSGKDSRGVTGNGRPDLYPATAILVSDALHQTYGASRIIRVFGSVEPALRLAADDDGIIFVSSSCDEMATTHASANPGIVFVVYSVGTRHKSQKLGNAQGGYPIFLDQTFSILTRSIQTAIFGRP